MKIIKLIQNHKQASDDQIRDFIYRNMSQEMITGLEYDDPKTISRALALFGIELSDEDRRSISFVKDLKETQTDSKTVDTP